MELPTFKPNLLGNVAVKILSFLILILAIRFAYFIALAGSSCGSNDFCFFPENLYFRQASVTPSVAPSGDLYTTKIWRKAVDYYSSVFEILATEGFLSSDSRVLCIETLAGVDVQALKDLGVVDVVGISEDHSLPLVVSGEGHRQPFDDDYFDFVFAGNAVLDWSDRPVDFASEVCRTLKQGGFFVAHTRVKDLYSFNSLLELFNCCRLIRSREINGMDTMPCLEIVMSKNDKGVELLGEKGGNYFIPSGSFDNICSVPAYKMEIIKNSEPLIEKEPLKPWITLKRNVKNMKYLSSMVDISFKQRYVYIDVGARNYGSSIASWFRKQYPKQNKRFEVYAIEADRTFHGEYKRKKGVILLRYAAWVRNETLFFGITRDPSEKFVSKSRGMGRIQPVRTSTNMRDVDKIEGFDFAEWLKNTVSSRDYVVVKMDVEGTEFHLIPRLMETGAICLIDEIFLECHYNRWQKCCPGQRSVKFQKTYAQCLDLFTSLRESGVLVHQWW